MPFCKVGEFKEEGWDYKSINDVVWILGCNGLPDIYMHVYEIKQLKDNNKYLYKYKNKLLTEGETKVEGLLWDKIRKWYEGLNFEA